MLCSPSVHFQECFATCLSSYLPLSISASTSIRAKILSAPESDCIRNGNWELSSPISEEKVFVNVINEVIIPIVKTVIPLIVKFGVPNSNIIPPANAINTYNTFPSAFIIGNKILLIKSAFWIALFHSSFLSQNALIFRSS